VKMTRTRQNVMGVVTKRYDSAGFAWMYVMIFYAERHVDVTSAVLVTASATMPTFFDEL
jgi:hypothetical protein